MTIAANLGFPRIGKDRELKKATEGFWSQKLAEVDLLKVGANLREQNWKDQKRLGIHHIPSNDFSFYDQILDAAQLLGVVPDRYKALSEHGLGRYFAMARGHQAEGVDLQALEMTKWFDTNYHYLVPEISEQGDFRLSNRKPIDYFREAHELGVKTKPVLIGPVTFLLLAKKDGAQLLRLLDRILPVYEDLISQLGDAEWIQIDEPSLVLDLSVEAQKAFTIAYERFSQKKFKSKLILTTYFGALGDNLDLAVSLPVDGLHVDLVRAPEQGESVAKKLPISRYLSAGVVDGRNIWRCDLDKALDTLKTIAEIRGGTDKLIVAPSCSLLHTPVDLSSETKLDDELKSWLAFALDKLQEVSVLAEALDAGHANFPAFKRSRDAIASRAKSARVHDLTVKKRLDQITAASGQRQSPFSKRLEAQKSLSLPAFPTTTIGSFPQTKELRATRAAYKAKKLDDTSYNDYLKKEVEAAVRWQEELDIDVLVHGEFERNDMVEYFGEQLSGFAFTEFGWVQSYGSRCVKPPIIYGDVSRPEPMTVEWAKYAQSLTKRPMKGMLTGPVTILQWSFVRTDQPRSETCKQIALAIRDEVVDLEKAGLKIIQIDEAAIREGLPLRQREWKNYLNWAVESFRISASGVKDSTQIHTHMCYSEFNDIIEAVAAMDADVVSIETSRSQMELLKAFAKFKYPNEVGPGVYDIHSPRVPSENEMVNLPRKASEVLNPKQLWVNPDCGLKTRGWAEVRPALASMVSAAKRVRAEFP